METNSIDFIRTIQSNWDNISNKKEYNDSIVFIEDTKLIWSNSVYYATHSFNDFNKDFNNDF